MLDQPKPLSSDLEWVLQSGQVKQDLLAQILVEEHYLDLWRLAICLFGDSELARDIASEVLTTAILDAYRYRSTIGGRIWLYNLAFEVFGRHKSRYKAHRLRKISHDNDRKPWASLPVSFEYRDQFLFLLHYLLGWPKAEIARLLGESETAVEDTLEKATGAIWHACQMAAADRPPEPPNWLQEIANPSDLAFRLPDLLFHRCPLPDLKDGWQQELTSQLLADASQRAAALRWFISLKEVSVTVLLGLIAVMLIWWADRSLPDEVGRSIQTQIVYATRIVKVRVTTTPVGPPATPHPSKDGPAQVETYIVREGDTLASIAVKNEMHLEALLSLNGLDSKTALKPGEVILLSPGTSRVLAMRRVQSTPNLDPTPLRAGSSSQEIIQKMKESSHYWHTLWYEAQIIRYGPVGYTGPPRERREQVWVKQPYNALVLTAPAGYPPDRVWFTNNKKVYQVDNDTGIPVLYDFHSYNLPVYSSLEDYIFPSGLADSGDLFIPQSLEQVAGRETLVVDRKTPQGLRTQRLWVDTKTGMVLKALQFAEGSNTVTTEVKMLKLFLDASFPDHIFVRRQLLTGFAKDFRGEPLPGDGIFDAPQPDYARYDFSLPHIPPPPDLILSDEPLLYQWAQDPPKGEDYTLDLFAGEYYLGTLDAPDPQNLVCQRSSDGALLAFYSSDDPSLQSTTPLQWVNLQDLSAGSQTIPDLKPAGSLAFAPNNRHLAFSACSGEASCGIYLLDLATGSLEQLLPVDLARSLVWSPDGGALALIGVQDPQIGEEILLVDTMTGEVLYQVPYKAYQGSLPEDIPILDWGTDFPSDESIKNACMSPVGE